MNVWVCNVKAFKMRANVLYDIIRIQCYTGYQWLFQVHSFRERNTGAEQHFDCNIMSPYRALSFAERQRCASCFGTASLGPKWRKGQLKQFSSSKGNSVFSSLSHSCHSVNVFGVGRNCNLGLDQNTGDRIWATIAIACNRTLFSSCCSKARDEKNSRTRCFPKKEPGQNIYLQPRLPHRSA